jgi:hypothetical protein
MPSLEVVYSSNGLGSRCCTIITHGHAGCLSLRKKTATDRQTDMDEPIRCSSLTLEREEHLQAVAGARVEAETSRIRSMNSNPVTSKCQPVIRNVIATQACVLVDTAIRSTILVTLYSPSLVKKQTAPNSCSSRRVIILHLELLKKPYRCIPLPPQV